MPSQENLSRSQINKEPILEVAQSRNLSLRPNGRERYSHGFEDRTDGTSQVASLDRAAFA